MSDDVFIRRETLIAMAEAVREATGEAHLFSVEEMRTLVTRARSIIERTVTSVKIPEGTTRICSYAFYGCKSLTSVVIPNSVTEISQSAFDSCKSLTSVVIPSSVKVIISSFVLCEGLTSVTFEGKPDKIIAPFTICTNLTTINVPWAEGEVDGAPWGATNATINYNYAGG